MPGFQVTAFQRGAFQMTGTGKTVLEMVQTAEAELGLPQDTTVTGAGVSATGTQLFALANRAVDELRRMPEKGWACLQWEYNLQIPVGLTTTGDMEAGSAVITNIPDTSELASYIFAVSGSGIPQAARIASIDSSTQVTMDMLNTNTEDLVGTSLIFAQDTVPMPPGFDWFQNRTMWDRTNRWELLGPDSPQMDQWHRSGIVATGPRRHFRQLGPYTNAFRIWPPPTEISAPLQLVFEYMSNSAVMPNGSTTTWQQYFTSDDDQCLLDQDALIMCMKWMFWEAKGFGSYVTLQNRWVDYVDKLMARDGAAPTLSMVKRVNPIFISPSSVQDGFFPGPVGPNSS